MPRSNFAAGRSAYIEKLKDPRWQKLRLQVFERDNWQCQACYETELMLHVHHRRYLSNTEPWEYPLELLVTLCEVCHEEEKENMQQAMIDLGNELKERFLATDIDKMVHALRLAKKDLPKTQWEKRITKNDMLIIWQGLIKEIDLLSMLREIYDNEEYIQSCIIEPPLLTYLIYSIGFSTVKEHN